MKKITFTQTETWIFLIFFIFFFGDLFTTLTLGDLANHLESNPLFMLTNSFAWIVVLNIVFGLALVYFYRKQKTKTKFFIVSYVCALMILRIFAIYSALMIAADPPSLQEAAAISTAQKINWLSTYMLLLFIIPLFTSNLSFWLFSLDHKIEKKEAKKPQK